MSSEARTGLLDRYFELSASGSNVRRELVAGTTTFLAMAYILFVNPSILGETGMDAQAVFVATALAGAFGTLVMGLWARYPVALAPGMGLNAFFAFTVVLTMGIPWQTALAGTFVSGLIFFVLAVSGIREAIINAIPMQLKLATGAGIGLFIAFIGLKNAGIVVPDESTFVALGSMTRPETLLAAFGLVITAIFLVRKVRGGVFYGMIITAAVGVLTGLIEPPGAVVGSVPSLAPTFGEAITNLPELLSAQLVIVVFTMLFVDFFDTSGALIAIANQAGFLKDGKLPRARRAFVADALATMGGAVAGTSTTTSYIESSSGVASGGRTGLTSVFTATFFLLSLFFSPLLAVVTPEVTAPALILVGVLMARSLGDIDWSELEFAIPAFLTVIAMPLTYSIANGIAFGLLIFPLLMAVRGRWREVHPVAYGLCLVFLAYFGWLAA
ncbi:AGZA family xanthine/uracil permease-like MFS transporter [Tamaricihabitans halophyticus]|uniref:AGZA family xanthine/uracil permease-like MFS transporter n=1 Tax=Tamaricihabitans halophyticus TaxID=1262583 RepID=A0A4R2PZL7_9PSEU|nr:NCS2 family permease [Tamaricihabitans halophyticus]TCP40688.1 AGZA family xanthine/uracil permease-like MFS transporter [Tamaricihabitans halophyticus]